LFRFLLEGVEGLAISPAILLTWPVLKRRFDNWGSTEHEQKRTWKGDDLVIGPKEVHTRAVSIEAAPHRVWPWLVQFGLGKAGFYSYELLERLLGIPVTNLESIQQSMQTLHVGDEVLLHPKAPGIPVAYVEQERHICFGKVPSSGSEPDDPPRSWSLYLEPGPEPGQSCRLLLRSCIGRPSTPKQRLARHIEEPIDFVMEQRMLRTLKRLAEQDVAAS
jgi:hypothetical protein